MGRVSFSEENKVQSGSDFPKLKLEKGESARIVAIEEPHAEFVHRLQMPKLVNGEPIFVTKERKNGEKYQDYDYDFVGNPICLGDEGVLLDKGLDPKNCPACELAREGDMASPPVRRFAMHVVKYATKPGKTEIQTPFQASIVVWAFTGRRFDKLVDLAQEHGNLQERDLLLGPCINAGYQNFDINISGKAEWLASPERKQLVLDAFRENQAKDLASFCGRRTERRWLEDDLDKIRDRWRAVSRAKPGAEKTDLSGAEAASLATGLDDLLSAQTGSAVPAAAESVDLFAGLKANNGDGDKHEEEPVTSPAAAEAQPVGVKPGSSGETVSFDDLLGKL